MKKCAKALKKSHKPLAKHGHICYYIKAFRTEKPLAKHGHICYYIKAFRTEADSPHVAHGLGGGNEASGGNNKYEKENTKWQSYP